jgi:hypothetical protein
VAQDFSSSWWLQLAYSVMPKPKNMTPCEIAGCAGERRALVGRAAREPDHAARSL